MALDSPEFPYFVVPDSRLPGPRESRIAAATGGLEREVRPALTLRHRSVLLGAGFESVAEVARCITHR